MLNHKINRKQKIKQIIKKTPGFIYFKTGVRLITHKDKPRIEKSINKFLPEEKKTDSFDKTKLYRDILFALSKNLIIPDEYFLYEFENKTKEERREFIGYNESIAINLRINNDVVFARNLLTNKMNSYLKYEEYYGREIIEIIGSEDEEKFNSFIDKNGKCMLKPIDKTKGEGILVISKENGNYSLKKIFEEKIQEGRFLLEQLVKQGEELKQYHQQSVNTVRLVSFLKDDNTVDFLFAILRIGRGDMIVDNLGAGGIAAAIDISNGEIITDGFTENGEIYTHHPNSGLRIKGGKMPEWKTLLQIATEAAVLTPEIKMIGWDFAWSINGWIIIEANRDPSYRGIQMTTKKGIRPTFIDKIGKPYV